MLILALVAATIPKGSTLIDVATLNVVVGGLLPILVDLITHARAPVWVKATVSILLSAIASVLTQVAVNGGLLVWRLALLSVMVTFVTNLAVYLGVWKPMQIGGETGAVQRITGGAGLGAPDDPTVPSAPPAPGELDTGRSSRGRR